MNKIPPFESLRMLKDLCTIGIGGPAKWYIEVHTVEEMLSILKYTSEKKLRTFILGRGSNTLFDDCGFDGVVIHNKISSFKEKSDGIFHVGSGYNFSRFGTQTAKSGWTGLEFAAGIPGTVGGAVFMNAGANGTETCEHLISVDFVTDTGEYKTFEKETLKFSYRHSCFHHIRGAIVGATFSLTKCEKAREKQLSIIDYRTKNQPCGEKSAGCMFRNPESQSAGSLIETSGLKGKQIGDAQISNLHGNFLINTDQASSKDVLKLVQEIQAQVKSKYEIELESEVRYIPYRDDTI